MMVVWFLLMYADGGNKEKYVFKALETSTSSSMEALEQSLI